MHVTTTYDEDTKVTLTVVAEPAELATVKAHVLKSMSKNVKVPGFRQGKAPAHLIEKQLEPDYLQSEFLNHALNDLYGQAIDQENLRVVAQPEVSVTKFVPFDTLEFTATVEVVGKVKLADYKTITGVKKPVVTVSAADVDEVLKQLRERDAEKQDVARAAKDGDQVVIDFKGVDAKTKEAIPGADGTEYGLVIGSNTFIPGFEPELIGLKAGDEKTFTVTFPKDYGTVSLQGKQVTFTVTVHKVQAVTLPKLDAAFAAKIGPFTKLEELKADIKKQLTIEREREAEQAYENELLTAIAEKTDMAIPKAMVDDQLERMEREEKQNLMYRGVTWQEHLKEEGLTDEAHREKNREPATMRVKAGLVLSEIAEAEQLVVTPEELEIQIQLLKGQHKDDKMQEEIDKPENRRDIASRILTQKTLAKLKEYNTAKK